MLLGVLVESAIEGGRVRCGENDESVEQLGVMQGEGPGGGSAPVMADQHEAPIAELRRQRPDILSGVPGPVVLDRLRLGGEVVATQVRGDGEMIAPELRQLVAPHVPALGEAVQEDHQRAGAGVGVVKPNAAEIGEVVSDIDFLRCAH